MKKTILIALLIIIIVLAAYFLFRGSPENEGAGITPNPSPVSSSASASNNYDIQGMKIEIIKEGTGEAAKNGDMVTVHYIGTFENGEKFDSSIDRGIPFSFELGARRVIQGWDLGVLGMKIGEKRKLTIPSELGYGATGTPGGPIPPNATLLFEVELLKIN